MPSEIFNCQQHTLADLRELAHEYGIEGKTKKEICSKLNRLLPVAVHGLHEAKVAMHQNKINADDNSLQAVVSNLHSEIATKKNEIEQLRKDLHESKVYNHVYEKHLSSNIDEIVKLKEIIAELKHDHEYEVGKFHKIFAEFKTHVASFAKSEKCYGDQYKMVPFLMLQVKEMADLRACLTSSVDTASFGGISLYLDQEKNVSGDISPSWIRQFTNCKSDVVVTKLTLAEYYPNGTRNGHQNLLIFDKKQKTYERFEPNGSGALDFFTWVDAFLASDNFKQSLKIKGYIFVPTATSCPMIGPQVKQKKLKEEEKGFCKDGGYCVVFSTITAHLKLLAPDISIAEISAFLLSLDPEEILDLIQRYNTWMETTVPDFSKDPESEFHKFINTHNLFSKEDLQEQILKLQKDLKWKTERYDYVNNSLQGMINRTISAENETRKQQQITQQLQKDLAEKTSLVQSLQQNIAQKDAELNELRNKKWWHFW